MTQTTLSSPTVTTITAELHVIKIGNKQMTISVFNQLYDEECWDKNYNITNPIWGKVLRDNIEYIIFQKGSELRKTELPGRRTKQGYEEYLSRSMKWEELKQEIEVHLKAAKPELKGLVDNIRSLMYARVFLLKEKLLVETILIDMDLFYPQTSQRWKENYRIYCSNTDKYNKMVTELESSTQLFIAV